MKSRKPAISRLLSTGALVLMVVSLASCGGAPTQAAPATTAPTTAPTQAAPTQTKSTEAAKTVATAAPASGSKALSGKLTMTFWGNENDINSQKASADAFMKLHPDVKIEVMEGNGCGADYSACKTLIAGGTMPDVFVPGIWNYNRMTEDGVLTDLTANMQKDNIKPEDFNKNVIAGMKALKDGKVYGLPMGYNVQSMYYNKDMFDKAGLKYPAADGNYTWQDVRDWAKKLTIDESGNTAESAKFDPKKVKQWGYATLAAIPISPGYDPMLLAFGGSTMSLPDRQKCNLENPDSIRAWQFIQDMMYKDHSTVTPDVHQEQGGYLRWVAGNVAMQQGSHEQVLLVQKQNPSLKFDMAALPKEKAGNATVIQMHIWSIYANSKNKDLAWEFVKWVATEGSGTQMGLVPAYKDFALGKYFLQAPGEPAHLKEAQIDPASWPLAVYPTNYNQKTDDIGGQDGFGPALTSIIQNEKPAADVLKGICAKVDAIMKK